MKKYTLSLVLMLGALVLPVSASGQVIYGDVNGDQEVNIADVNAVIDVILGSGSNATADINNDSEINIADVNAIIDIILGGEPPHDAHECVDLGLPSGTMWASMNVGASSPEDYGDYFAWGETEPKRSYTEANYKWYGGSWYNHSVSITKYCTDSDHGLNGFVDNKTVLDPEDDAAYVNWGSSWRMPSFEQIDELMDCCSFQWIQRNGVYGILVTGVNGNSIFLPAAGYHSYDELLNLGSFSFYWTRDLSASAVNFAYCMTFDADGYGWWHFYRDSGITVRAVRVQ